MAMTWTWMCMGHSRNSQAKAKTENSSPRGNMDGQTHLSFGTLLQTLVGG